MRYKIDTANVPKLSLDPDTRIDEVIQEIFTVLNTPVGSIPCYREFGIDQSYRDKPIGVAKALFAAAITESIEAFVPGVYVDKITFSDDASNPATLFPTLDLTILEVRLIEQD